MTLQQRLKKLTAPLHDHLEQTRISKALLSQRIQPAEYCVYLKIMANIHANIEPQLKHFRHTELLSPRTIEGRLSLTLTDLKALNVAFVFERLPDIASLNDAQLFGALYVLEGSTLGGQVIIKRLTHLQTQSDQSFTRYLSGYGEQTMSQWQTFCQGLNAFGQTYPEQTDDVILGAIQTFSTITEQFHVYNDTLKINQEGSRTSN